MSEDALKLSEAEWAITGNAIEMLDDLRLRSRGYPDWRRMRLFSCACCRSVWHLLTDERSRTVIEIAERHTDGAASDEELATAASEARTVADATKKMPFKDATRTTTYLHSRPENAWMWATTISQATANALAKASGKKPAAREALQAESYGQQANLIRCIFGNPFRPVVPNPTWRTSAVSELAKAAYEDRQLPSGTLVPARLAVLADALEEAGAPAEVVAHLRSPSPHVRGCWAVDVALGRDNTPPSRPDKEPQPPPAVPVENPYTPCFGGQNDNGSHWLGFADFAGTAAFFEEAGYEGGGYGWHGVVDALVRLRAPKLRKKLSYDPEASLFTVTSRDAAAIRQVCDLIRAAIADPTLLREAIAEADRRLMEP